MFKKQRKDERRDTAAKRSQLTNKFKPNSPRKKAKKPVIGYYICVCPSMNGHKPKVVIRKSYRKYPDDLIIDKYKRKQGKIAAYIKADDLNHDNSDDLQKLQQTWVTKLKTIPFTDIDTII